MLIVNLNFLVVFKLVLIYLLNILVNSLICIKIRLILQLRNLLLTKLDLVINWNNKFIEIHIIRVFFIINFLIIMILEKLIGIERNRDFESLNIKFLKPSEFKFLMSLIINASNNLFKHFFFHHPVHYEKSKFIYIFKIFSLTMRYWIVSPFHK